MAAHPLQAERTRLLEHFSVPDNTFGSRWADLWDAGDFLPWDKGAPNPALEDILKDRRDLLGESVFIEEEGGKKRRKRALVPGCGRGYDVLLLASFGYDAYGLDISESAVKLCDEFAREHGGDYKAKDDAVGAGKVKFLVGDFFGKEWEREVEGGASFELLYDYTVSMPFRAISMPSWAFCGTVHSYPECVCPSYERGNSNL
jgi:methyl halide transferase